MRQKRARARAGILPVRASKLLYSGGKARPDQTAALSSLTNRDPFPLSSSVSLYIDEYIDDTKITFFIFISQFINFGLIIITIHTHREIIISFTIILNYRSLITILTLLLIF